MALYECSYYYYYYYYYKATKEEDDHRFGKEIWREKMHPLDCGQDFSSTARGK